MTLWMMWLVTGIVLLLPVALMVIFHGEDVADSRGRRSSHRWRHRTRRR
ncbi:MAG TPA: hypothetical protein VK875_13390 [Euzebyales bacterium]|nr:hypothetical protein [Euzebyales bacterium]